MITKEYKQYIYKKKQKVTILALTSKDTIARIVITIVNIIIIKNIWIYFW